MAENFSLAYLSHANQPFSTADLETLAAEAGQNNDRILVTGYLCYLNGQFFQYLEGSEPVVNELMAAISADPRHRITNVVNLGTSDPRLFPTWSMRYVSDTALKGIQLEHVLANVLESMRQDVFGEARIQTMVRSLITKISAQRGHWSAV